MIEMKKLVQQLNNATRAYDLGRPYMSDKEWDELYFQLQAMEKETGIVYPNSPTHSIPFEEVSELEMINHNHPMLSLDKTKDIAQIASYMAGHEWVAMFKMDGLTISLTYEKGYLTRAETRGDGVKGENVLHNVKHIVSIPKYIEAAPDKVIIDGEIICTYPKFEHFKENFKNPRNFAAGSIRLLSSKDAAARNLNFIAWDLIEGSDDDSFVRRLEQLQKWEFTVVPYTTGTGMYEEAIDLLDFHPYRTIYPIDGIVFKFDSVSYGKSLGATAHHFRNAIAYKFYDEEHETELINIEWSMGRTGTLTPIAIFKPVDINGTEVSRASLCNISIMKQTLGEHPFEGQKIYVAKRNQIIPKIERAKDEHGEWIK